MSDAYLTETLEAIEKTIAKEEANIQLGKDLDKLLTIDVFNSVIGEALLNRTVKEATNVIMNTLDPDSKEVREALEKIASVNRLKEFFEGIGTAAMYAPGKIEQEQEFRRELTAKAAKG